MICVHTYSSAARCPQIWKVSCTCVKGGYGRTWQVTLFSHHPEWQSLMCNQKLVPSSPLKPLSLSPAPVLRWPPTQGTCECQCQRQEILGGGFKSDDMTHRCEMTHFDTDHDSYPHLPFGCRWWYWLSLCGLNKTGTGSWKHSSSCWF